MTVITAFSLIIDSQPRFRVYNGKMNKKLKQIGELAKLSNVPIPTIRYYEKRGLLKPTKIKDSGYRLYSTETTKTVGFIKHAQELGFSLEEIRQLINLRAPSTGRCKRVRDRAKNKLNDVREKINMLSQIENTLEQLIKDCEKNKTSSKCPIIEGMEGFND